MVVAPLHPSRYFYYNVILQKILEPDWKIPILNNLVGFRRVTPVVTTCKTTTLGPATTKMAIGSNPVALFAKVVLKMFKKFKIPHKTTFLLISVDSAGYKTVRPIP